MKKKTTKVVKTEIYSEKRIREFDKAEADLASSLRRRKNDARMKPKGSVK